MSSWGGVLSSTNARRSVMTGVHTGRDCWGICWRAWWGRIPDATTLLFRAMGRAAELHLSQLSQYSASAETLCRHPCFAYLGVMFLGDLYASCYEPIANAFTLPRFLELTHCC